MANNFESNFTRKLAEAFMKGFENNRVLSRFVNTGIAGGEFDPNSGENVDFKRATDYRSSRTSDGDLTSETESDILTGKATVTVQDYFTVFVDFKEADQAIKMGTNATDLYMAPMARRIVTDYELDFAKFMMKNSGLLAGTFGTAVTTWDDVAQAGAVLESTGVPKDSDWAYSVNPYTQTNLASNQRSLGAGGAAGTLVSDSVRKATVSESFAGMRVMTATTLDSFTLPATGDLIGAVNGTPTATYVGAKDTMTQSITVDGFGTFTGTIPAGAVVQVTGVNRLNLSTRKPIIDGAGGNVLYTGTLTADASLTTGAGTFVVAGPAINEANGQYNTVDVAIADNDVITILGADSTLYQPNLFWHKDAFALASVPIQKLHSTDTIGKTEDGLMFRVSKGSNWTKNTQQVRFDFRPAYGCLNPFYAGQGWG